MNDTEILTIVLAAVPTMVTVLVGILINNSRLNDFRTHMDARFNAVDERFNSVNERMDARFNAVDQRFDDMRDLWRAELHRVEEVLDARLKHLETRG